MVFDLKDWFPDSAAAYFKNRFMQDLVRRSVWEITKRNLSNSNLVTTVSPSLVEKLRGLGFTAGLITNGVDTNLFKPMSGSETRAELGIGNDEFVIGFSGSVERWYAIDDMIRALPDLIRYRADTRMLIVGGSLFTNYRAELETLQRIWVFQIGSYSPVQNRTMNSPGILHVWTPAPSPCPPHNGGRSPFRTNFSNIRHVENPLSCGRYRMLPV